MKQSTGRAVYSRMTLLLRALFVALLCATVIATSLAGGCTGHFGQSVVRGSGTVAAEARDAAGFSEVRVSGTGDVVIVVDRAAGESLKVEAEDNILPLLETTVRGGVLHLGVKAGESISPTRPVVYRVTARELGRVEVTGSGTVRATGIDANRFVVDISGSGGVDVAGHTESLEIHISGSGSVDAAKLRARVASVAISGSGNAGVNASDHVDATISGSGSVRYAGDPKVQTRIAGSGAVSKR